ncbi:hypothetical protein VNO78_06881 [Psophocarpus tetragonolobus]|uniref:Uncharacterized protein n=1 Tax=Psophocarpus tetragonolobus TaxID=3891 RepID=A0AAN9T266_PSOTE
MSLWEYDLLAEFEEAQLMAPFSGVTVKKEKETEINSKIDEVLREREEDRAKMDFIISKLDDIRVSSSKSSSQQKVVLSML